MVKLMT